MKISLIAAVAENGVIGQGGQLPWRLPADLRHFKSVTLGKPVLMGRRTWQSIGRPLPGRRNLVISRDPAFQAGGAECYASVEDALAALADAEEVMVIGGAELYRLLQPKASRLYLTRVMARPPGDAFFPELDAGWRLVKETPRPADAENPHAMVFQEWVRD